MLGSPDSRYKLVPVQSCWSTARLTFIDEDEFFEEDSEREKEPPRRRTVHPDIQKIVDRLEKRVSLLSGIYNTVCMPVAYSAYTVAECGCSLPAE